MDNIRYFLASGIFLVCIWTIALLVGLWPQLKQALSNWVSGTSNAIQPNFVLTYVLRLLGLGRQDRLTCTLFTYNALMLWPLTLILAYPLIKAFRIRELNFLENERAGQGEITYLPSTQSTPITNDRVMSGESVAG